MSIRWNTLVFHVLVSRFVKKTLFFLMLALACPVFSQKPVSLDEVKKEADRLFEDDEFTKAYKLYAQLVSNFPKDPLYNYRLGVCMIYSEPDKKKCIPYLKAAAANKEAPRDALFYLGKAYHINYRFDDAIKNYGEYKKTASAARQKKLQVDREITACNNGKHLLSNLSDLVVQNKKELNEADFFRSYDLKNIGGKLLVKPEEFKTAVDKKKKEKSVVFLPKGSNVVYFSSYGDNADNGKDIYTVAKLPSGEFGKPEKLKGINTEFDEDYPFLHPDGKTLYFASKGYNSMGGYDIFKTVYNENTNSWTAPVNLEFPINSPDDDFLFVTDSLEKTAYFSTGRQSPPGKIDVLKINTERKPIDILVIKGTVVKENAAQSLNSVIVVKNSATQEAVGTFSAADNGDYSMELPNGANLEFSVETPGLKTQNDNVSLPMATTSKPFRQTISYENGELKIINYFDEATSDEDYLQYLKLIEKKAKLDVNEGGNKLELPTTPTLSTAPADTAANVVATAPKRKNNSTGPEIVEDSASSGSAPATPVTAPKQNLDNKQLASIARQDADESKQEASQMEKDSRDAYEVGQKQKAEAQKKLAGADSAVAAAEAITNDEEKKTALQNALALKTAAEGELAVAEKILSLSKSLNDDAQNKRKEANLNSEYAKELEKTATGKNQATSQSLAKLEQLQNEIAETAGKKKASAEALNALKNDIEEKEKQLAAEEKISGDIKTNLDDIKTAVTTKEKELSETRKKAAKQELTTQIETLKTEQSEKELQLAQKEKDIKKINDELANLKNEQDIANRIKTEDIAPTTPAPAIANAGNALEVSEPINTTSPASSEKKTSVKELQEKYKDKLSIADPKNSASITESTAQLKNYNKEIDQAIAINKADLAKAKTPAAKQTITTELKQLENSKRQNQQFIASNNKLAADLNKAVDQPLDASKFGMYPVTAATPAEAVKGLNQLAAQLTINESDNFDFNGYQNPQAQTLKVEADSKINDAIAQQKKLKETIEASKAELANSSPASAASPSLSLTQLNKEAEDLQAKAQETRNAANAKTGAEKDKLMGEAKQLEDKANDTYLQAAGVTKEENNKAFGINNENIEALIKENKSEATDAASAKKLSEEATTAFKQAAGIRKEAESLANKGAMLGSLSNAEEKEAEAVLKQQQAIELLKKANPDLLLKTPEAPVASSNGVAVASLDAQLEAVNKNLAELVNTKIESYQKLYEANNLEMEQLSGNIKEKQTQLDNTPSLKSDLIAASAKTDNAKTLKAKADESTNAAEKLTQLVAAIKKQNEAVKQTAALNTALGKLTVAEPAKQEPVAQETETSGKQETVSGNTQAPSESEPAKTEALPTPALLEPLAKSDTTGGQIVRYFNSNIPELKNQKAGNLVRNSLTQLKNAVAEEKAADDEIAALQGGSAGEPAELKAQADNLLVAADDLSTKAQEARTEAASKSGQEKEDLLEKAKQLDNQAHDKSEEAASLTQRANEASYSANAAVADELLTRLKSDNPGLFSDLDQKNDELTTQRSQARALRNEASTLSNDAARIGAIGNAEEKETELLQKQDALIAELKKQYPDYVAKKAEPTAAAVVPENLLERKNAAVEKQYTELTNLTNAFSLEYESSKNSLPKKLSAEQSAAKQKAETLNNESKRLLISASKEKNGKEKIKQMTLAAKAGHAAIAELKKLAVPETNLTATETPVNTTVNTTPVAERTENEAPVNVPATVPTVNRPAATANPTPARPARNTARTAVKVAGLEIIQGNAYSAAKPIPLNAKMEDGLIFRVQIGAFKVQLPDDAFRGLSPLNAETTANGYFRYTAGNFNQFEIANAVKNDLRRLGYSDAFVVGYYNGKRISISEALALLEKEGKPVDLANAPQTAGITANSNVPKVTTAPAQAAAVLEPVQVTRELEQSNGLLYTIQIGVYLRASQQTLLNLRPIFTERLPGGLFRFTAGIYNNTEKLIADKRRVVDLGIKDAFVAAYLNGKRIPFGEAKTRQEKDQSIKMEAENPIVFSGAGAAATNAAATAQPISTVNSGTGIQPFSNGVSNYPAATSDNGIKTGEDGISFKVQVGAYSKQVPADVAEKFAAIKNWPVENKQINTLYIYNIGNFSEARFAKQLKDEAVRLGLTDAFITVYKDGKKLYGADANQYIGR